MAYVITEDGEANFIGIADTNTGNWVARIQFNGELSVIAQNNLARHIVYGLEQELFWTFRYEDEEIDFGSNYPTRDDCIEAAEKWYDEKIMAENGGLRNGESFDDEVQMIEFRLDIKEDPEVVSSETYIVEYVHYHGDAAEHSTY